MALEHPKSPRSRLPLAGLVVASAALAVALFVTLFVALRGPVGDRRWAVEESSLQRTRNTKVLKVGYSGFRPYTVINLGEADPNKRVTGFCVDMIHEMASRQTPPWQVEWAKVNFETLRADMDSGKFDVFADAVYQTIPRASEFGFTRPYSYFGVAAGVVRKGDQRFKSFADLDRDGVTVSLAEGWTSTEYARRHLTKPKFLVVTVGDDPFVQFQDVISGRADIALQDVPTVYQFVREHPNEVESRWIDSPPTRVAAGFMTRRGDWEMIHFLDVSLDVLQAEGTMDRLNAKWQGLSDFPKLNLVPGQGLPK